MLGSGKVFSWGRSDFGQLGRTSTAQKEADDWPQIGLVFDPTPHLVPIPNAPVQSISAGAEHSLVLTTDGHIWTWGWNEHGMCGVDSEAPPLNPLIEYYVRQPKPVRLPNFNGFASLLAAGHGHSLAFVNM